MERGGVGQESTEGETSIVSGVGGQNSGSNSLGDSNISIALGDDGLDTETRVVTARGTEHGLVLRIDGKADWQFICQELDHFLGGRKKFFEGGEVSIEWVDRLPSVEQSKELGEYLLNQYGLRVVTRRRRSAHVAPSYSGGNPVPGPASLVPLTRTTIPNLANSIPAQSIPAQSIPVQSLGVSGFDTPGAQDFTGKGGYQPHNLYSADPLGVDPLNFSPLGVSQQGTGSSGFGNSSLDSYTDSFSDGERGMTLDPMNLSSTPLGSGYSLDSQLSCQLPIDSSDSTVPSSRRVASQMAKMLGGPDLFYEDDANAKVIFGTLRSGQKVETPFSLVVVGDVNPGADLIAGGDIIVLGSLRGTAHASAYDDDAFDRVIIALQMQPMQLRIGSVLSRGSGEVVRGAEIARIENRRIVVEGFNPRMLWGRKVR